MKSVKTRGNQCSLGHNKIGDIQRGSAIGRMGAAGTWQFQLGPHSDAPQGLALRLQIDCRQAGAPGFFLQPLGADRLWVSWVSGGDFAVPIAVVTLQISAPKYTQNNGIFGGPSYKLGRKN